MIGTEVLPNDLLLNITGGSLGRCAIVPENFQRGNVSQHVCIMRPIFVVSEYFHAFVLSSIFSKSMKITGSGREGLPKYNLERMFFPLPPLSEQHRIVSEIENWFALIDQIEKGKLDLQKVIKKAKNKILPASELLKRINPKAEITCDNGHSKKLPQGWYPTFIKDIFIINPKNKVNDDTDAGFIKMSNIDDGFINQFSVEKKKWYEIRKGFTHFSDGDIAVAKISPCLENRKSIVLHDLPNGIGAGTTELYVFKPLCVYPLYGLYFFKSDYFIEHCMNSFNGVVGQQRVAKSVIENLEFELPPIVEQQRIVAKIEELFSVLDNIQNALEA